MNYLLYSFVPSFVAVGSTWFSFWVSPAPALTRVWFILLCLLVEAGLMCALKTSVPEVGGHILVVVLY